ncbi:MAG TPA: ABC transporter ATP-binding protein [Elusimicrobia bacterium]|jgi:molybdopterin-binding protein|nr:ABC transporter ATP-binding protein [Elusimicrobiota bacterium]
MQIQTINLTKKFVHLTVLEKINITLNPGIVTVFIGPNGAGKTTLLRLLDLLIPPTEGEILYNGKPANINKLLIRRKMGFVPQNPIMFTGTVWDNLTYGLKVRKMTEVEKNADKVLSLVNLEKMRSQPAGTLSGGEKQRLAIARVLVYDPEVIFFDEPTANLDPLSTAIIEELIPQLAKENKTIVLATHNLWQARRYGEQIYFLSQGKIIQQGNGEKIFRQPESLTVAEFTGITNIWHGYIDGQSNFIIGKIKIAVAAEGEGQGYAFLRAEEILLAREPVHSSARNCLLAEISRTRDLGYAVEITAQVGDLEVYALITRNSLEELALTVGKKIYLVFKATSVHISPL